MRGRVWGPLAIAIALGAMTAGGVVVSQNGGTPGDPGVANLWMDTNGGTCTRQSTAGAYVDAQACSTINAAVVASSAGDVIRVKAGSYGNQTVALRDNGNNNDVIVTEANGESVTLNDLDNSASHITYRGFTVTVDVTVLDFDPNTTVERRDITFDQINGENVFDLVGEVWDINITNGDWGPEVNGHPRVTGAGDGGGVPNNIIIRKNTFHDFTRSGSAVHTECLQVLGGVNVTIDSNTFTNCDGTAALAVANDLGFANDIEVINNWFDDAGDSGFAMQVSANVGNVQINYNSASAWIFIVNNPCSGCNMRFVGNYAPFNSSVCASGITSLNNVWRGGTCNSSDLNVSTLQFVDAANFDLHLASGSNAIGQGDPTDFPALDIDGDIRTSPTDAGADQRT